MGYLYNIGTTQGDIRLSDPTVLRGGGGSPQTITANGLSQTVAFGGARLNQNIAATGRAQAVALGAARLNQNISASGVSQPSAFGSARLNQTISASGAAQVIAFGSARLNRTIVASGAVQAVAFGAAQLRATQTITGTGLAQPGAFGSGTITTTTVEHAVGGGGYSHSQVSRLFSRWKKPQTISCRSLNLVSGFGIARLVQNVSGAENTKAAFGFGVAKTGLTITATSLLQPVKHSTTARMNQRITAVGVASLVCFTPALLEQLQNGADDDAVIAAILCQL